MPALKKARAIRPGARIGIAAPAGVVSPERIEEGEALIRRLGFEPFRRADLGARRGYLAGDDERRAAELMELVADPAIDAILCARGGYGCHRIVGRLDAALVRKAAKPLVANRAITTVMRGQRRCAGLVGIHGPMLERRHTAGSETLASLVRALSGCGAPLRLPGRTLCEGWAEGRLVGGSLSLVAASLGTPWEIDTRGAILMLEEVGELPYRVDRMLQQLLAAGKFESLAGVGIGSIIGCEDERYPDLGVDALLRELLPSLGVPVLTDLPFGHGEANLAWPLGARAAIDADRGEIELLESGVARR